MTIFVWTPAGFVHKATGEPMYIPPRDEVCCPRVQSDMDEIRSPIDGKPISSRSQLRDELARHDCVLVPPRKRKGYSNPSFAVKRGLPLSEEAQDKHKLTNKHVRP